MSDRSVLIFAAGVFSVVVADLTLNGGQVAFFLMLKTTDLVEYLAFWR